MTLETMMALAGFAFVTSVTPGPSNLILLAAGTNFGFRRCIPLVLGLNLSFVGMLVVVGMGLGQVLQADTGVYTGLKVLSLLYILWLAWKIARSRPPSDAGTDPVRLSFLQMALLQWVNPKAWVVALAVTAAYTTPDDFAASLGALAVVFGLVNLPSVGLWAASGSALRHFLRNPRAVRIFNLAMAVLLVVAVVPIALELGPR